MGVKGLWELLAPAGRRVAVEHALAGKRVAVDASVWLTQFVRAAREADSGAMVRNAHLLGAFRRCCKLLYYGVRPVFVFDGATPALKRRTLDRRRRQRERQAARVRRAAEKLLLNRLKREAVDGAVAKLERERAGRQQRQRQQKQLEEEEGGGAERQREHADGGVPLLAGAVTPTSGSGGGGNDQGVNRNASGGDSGGDDSESVEEVPARGTGDATDAFDALWSTATAAAQSGGDGADSSNAVANYGELARIDRTHDDGSGGDGDGDDGGGIEPVDVDNVDLDSILLPDSDDIDGDALAALPPAVQNEVLTQLKHRARVENRGQAGATQHDPDAFSRVQIDGFLRATRLNKNIRHARTALAGSQCGGARRIASDPRREYFYITGADAERECGTHAGACGAGGAGNGGASGANAQSKIGLYSGNGDGDENDRDGGNCRRGEIDGDGDNGIVGNGFFIAAAADDDHDDNNNDNAHGGDNDLVSENDSDTFPHGKKSARNAREQRARALSARQALVAPSLPSSTKSAAPCDSAAPRDSGAGWARVIGPCTMFGGAASAGGTLAPRATYGAANARAPAVATSSASGGADENYSTGRHAVLDSIGGAGAGGHDEMNDRDVEDNDDDDDDDEDDDEGRDEFDHVEWEEGSTAHAIGVVPGENAASACATDANDAASVAHGCVGAANDNESDNAVREARTIVCDDGGSGGGGGDDDDDSENGLDEITERDAANDDKSRLLADATSSPPAHAWSEDAAKQYTLAERDARAGDAGADVGLQRALLEPTSSSSASSRASPATRAPDWRHAAPRDADNARDADDERVAGEACVHAAAHETNALLARPPPTVAKKAEAHTAAGGRDNARRHGADRIANSPDVGRGTASASDALRVRRSTSTSLPARDTDNDSAADFGSDAGERARTVAVSIGTHVDCDRDDGDEVGVKDCGTAVREDADDGDDDDDDDDDDVSDGIDRVEAPETTETAGARAAPNESSSAPAQPREPEQAQERTRTAEQQQQLVTPPSHAPDADADVEARLTQLQRETTAEHADLRAEHAAAAKHADSVTVEMYADTRALLDLFGIPFMVAPTESEAQCAWFDADGLVDGVVTEDSDAFLFGARTVYRNIFEERKFVEEYEMRGVERDMGLDRDKLVHMALLLGSDYTDGVYGVGIVNASEIVNAFGGDAGGLAEFRQWVERVSLEDEAEIDGTDDGFDVGDDNNHDTDTAGDHLGGTPANERVDAAERERRKRVFRRKHRRMKRGWQVADASFPNRHVVDAYLRPNVNRDATRFRWRAPNADGLRRFCWEKFGWPSARTNDVLQPMLRAHQQHRRRGQQRRIDSYFRPERFARIRSVRLQDAVRGMASAAGGDRPRPRRVAARGSGGGDDGGVDDGGVDDGGVDDGGPDGTDAPSSSERRVDECDTARASNAIGRVAAAIDDDNNHDDGNDAQFGDVEAMMVPRDELTAAKRHRREMRARGRGGGVRNAKRARAGTRRC